MDELPDLALSVRQPWAWAIIEAGKNIENRSAGAIRHMREALARPRRIAVHAAKGMTRDEYEDARAFMAGLNVDCPRPDDLLRGGIVGSVEILGVTHKRLSSSSWLTGEHGLLLRRPRACPFIPCSGALGLFDWRQRSPRGEPTAADLPAKWMRDWGRPVPTTLSEPASQQGDLL